MADPAKNPDVVKLVNIQKEINRLNMSLRKLRNDQDQVEVKVMKYLTDMKISSIRIDDTTTITNKQLSRRGKKAKTDKFTDAISVLENAGVKESNKILEKLLESMKGEKMEVNAIKIQKKKNDE